MKTRVEGATAMPSKERRGSNSSVPSASRRSVTRTLARGIRARSVKFSFRSMFGIDDADDEVAPRIESFHRDLKLRRRGDQLEGIDRGRPQTCPARLPGNAAVRHQVEIEGTVLVERIAGANAIGDLAVQRTAYEARVRRFDGEAAGDPGDGDAAGARCRTGG